LPSLDEYVVQPQHIEQGVVALKQRQRKLSLWCMLSAALFIASSISYFLQPDFVYSFFGLSAEIQQLHMPMSVDANLASLGHQPDYFLNLLSWFGWLVVKIMVSFIGAFILVHYARKIHFFYVRFQSFILKRSHGSAIRAGRGALPGASATQKSHSPPRSPLSTAIRAIPSSARVTPATGVIGFDAAIFVLLRYSMCISPYRANRPANLLSPFDCVDA
jgi:hypothetical protein